MNAILSMDVYNRGYGSRLNDNGANDLDGLGGVGSKLGMTTILTDSKILQPTSASGESASFYALAYDTNNDGQADIISYRGTDSFLDSLSGWGVGVGSLSGDQARMAFEFYRSVAGSADPRTANISVTGHSMGGGLAGLVASVYGKTAAVFDTMAFASASNNAYSYATTYIPPAIIGYATPQSS